MEQIVRRLMRLMARVVLAIPAGILMLTRIRFVSLTHPERIGHLCVEPDAFLKEGVVGMRPRFTGVFLIPASRVANQEVLRLWSEKLPIVTSPFLCALLERLAAFPRLRYSPIHYAVAINETAQYGIILARWGTRPPLLRRPEELSERGRAALRRMGVPEGAWFVCIHSRDGIYSPADEHLHEFRNSEISNYILAMEAIVDRGGWCIRVGDPGSKPLPPMHGVVDYANSGEKSAWMDVFLGANCRFFLGNTSGLYLLSAVLGVPTAIANCVPVSGCYSWDPAGLAIPKRLRDRASGRYLSYAEILGSPMGNFRFAEQYDAVGLEVEENSGEEIRELAMEMLDRCAGAIEYSAADEQLQERFRSLFRPGHYCYGTPSRIGRDFLRKYSAFIEG